MNKLDPVELHLELVLLLPSATVVTAKNTPVSVGQSLKSGFQSVKTST